MKKSFPLLIFCIITLSILLILSVYLGFNGIFYKRVTNSMDIDIKAGNTEIIEVDKNESNVFSFVIDGSYLSGQTIPQNVEVLSLSDNVFVRAKLVCQENGLFSLKTSEKFSYEEDGYFYFNDILKVGEKALLTNGVEILPNAMLESGKKYLCTIVIETLSEEMDVNNVWKS